jgi:predicted RNA-binding Zn ribbon-like protein
MPAPYTVIEGVEVPLAVSGHPGLELCNTFAGWNGPTAHEYLAGYGHLVAWAKSTGLLSDDAALELSALAAAHPDDAATVLTEAREARARLYDVLLRRASPEGLDRVAKDVHAAAAHVHLVHDGPIRREVSTSAGLGTPPSAPVWQAGELLVSPALSRVCACPGTGCGWLFLDRSGRRRWCTMSTCGNRAKARRFAARHRGSD